LLYSLNDGCFQANIPSYCTLFWIRTKVTAVRGLHPEPLDE